MSKVYVRDYNVDPFKPSDFTKDTIKDELNLLRLFNEKERSSPFVQRYCSYLCKVNAETCGKLPCSLPKMERVKEQSVDVLEQEGGKFAALMNMGKSLMKNKKAMGAMNSMSSKSGSSCGALLSKLNEYKSKMVIIENEMKKYKGQAESMQRKYKGQAGELKSEMKKYKGQAEDTEKEITEMKKKYSLMEEKMEECKKKVEKYEAKLKDAEKDTKQIGGAKAIVLCSKEGITQMFLGLSKVKTEEEMWEYVKAWDIKIPKFKKDILREIKYMTILYANKPEKRAELDAFGVNKRRQQLYDAIQAVLMRYSKECKDKFEKLNDSSTTSKILRRVGSIRSRNNVSIPEKKLDTQALSQEFKRTLSIKRL